MSRFVMWLFILLLVQLFCIESVRSICHEYYAGLVPTMNGRIQDYALIVKSQVTCLENCAKICSLNTSCVTFFYNSKTGQCQAHSILLEPNPTDQKDENWRYYQIYSENCPQNDGFILYRKENICYFLSTEKKTWYQAKNECNKRGLRFMKITKKEVQDHLALLLSRYSGIQYYIGLKSKDGNNQWKSMKFDQPFDTNRWVWSDGEMLHSFINWAPNQSVRTGTTCVIMAAYQSRYWNNVKCSSSIRFICEKIL